MTPVATSGDDELLREVRRSKGASIPQLCQKLGVTTTAVRQRLFRLMAVGLIERRQLRQGRGRPTHVYAIAAGAESKLGSNYPDLALSLWGAIKQIADGQVRRELSRRVRDMLVTEYRSQIAGDSLDERLDGLVRLMADRGIRLEIDRTGPLPIILEHDCPYPELAAVDRGICALEKQVFDRVLGNSVKLTQCQMFGHSHCEYQARPKLLTVDVG